MFSLQTADRVAGPGPFLVALVLLLTPLWQCHVMAAPEDSFVASIAYRDAATLAFLAERLDIWEVDHSRGAVVALLRPDQADFVRSLGLVPVLDADLTAEVREFALLGIPGSSCYRTVPETNAAMAAMAASNPAIARVSTLGPSWDKTKAGGPPGHDIQLLILGNHTNSQPKFRFLLLGAIHAREYATAELALRFAEEIFSSYNTNPDATWLLDHAELHVIPVLNPDGRLFAESGRLWRKNTNTDVGCSSVPGVDLNRNHTFKWGTGGSSTNPCDETYRGPSAGSEPETKAIEAYMRSIFTDQRGPADSDPAPLDATGLMISLHSYSELVLYPWGGTSSPAPNEAGLRTLGRKFGYFNRYDVTQSIGLYPTSGTTDDWLYGTLGVAAYTFELGRSFFEPCSNFQNTILPNNLGALRYAFKAARRPYQTPFGPEVTNLAAGSSPVYQGAPLQLSGTADDTRSFDLGGGEPAQNINAIRASINAPSWSAPATLPLSPTGSASPVRSFSGFLPTAGLPVGRHTAYVEAQDSAGHWGVPTAVFFEILPDPNQPPSVSISAPTEGSTIPLPSVVAITASASDADGSVAKVFFAAGGTFLSEDTTAPFTATWQAPPGNHTLTATAVDDEGLSTTSIPVSIRVSNQSPVLALASPADGSSVTLPAHVVFSANATDADGSVAAVEFYEGQILLAHDAIPPFTLTHSSAPGTRTFSAMAIDNHGSRSLPSTATVTVVNPPPVILSTAPVDGSTWEFPARVDLTADASDSDGTVVRVEFQSNGQLIGSATSAPFSLEWSPPIGPHLLVATAVDNYGARTASATNRITVRNAIPDPPLISLTYPSNGQTLSQGTIPLTASASDPDGSVARVDFFHGTTLIASDSTPPFQATWSDVPPGNYTLSAQATDNEGQSTPSALVRIAIVPNLSPAVRITSPVAGDGLLLGQATMEAEASDADGSIVDVAFQSGTTLLGRDTSPPYQILWTPPSGGVYSVTATATDFQGATTTSSPVGFFVRTPANTSFQKGVGGYSGTVDTTLRGAAPVARLDSATNLPVDADDSGKPSQVLVRFDQIVGSEPGKIPLGSRIESASLSLQVFNSGSGFRIHRLLTPWAAESTWDSLGNGIQADGSDADSQPLGTLGANATTAAVTTGSKSIDLTSAVQAWANGAPNHGVALLPFPAGTDGVEFFSSEWGTASQRPKLAVSFIPPAPPLVWIVATDASAGELGPDRSLCFTLHRSGSLAEPLHVPLSANGSATPGLDYSGLPPTVTIPAGNATLPIDLTSLPDTLAEGLESLRLATSSSSAFVSIPPTSAEAMIADRPLQHWLFQRIADPALRNPAQDADHDGRPNLVEYFAGSDPSTPQSTPLLALATVANRSALLRFPRARDATDTSFEILWSIDLLRWHRPGVTSDGMAITWEFSTETPHGDSPKTIDARATLEGPSADSVHRLFFRLQVND